MKWWCVAVFLSPVFNFYPRIIIGASFTLKGAWVFKNYMVTLLMKLSMIWPLSTFATSLFPDPSLFSSITKIFLFLMYKCYFYVQVFAHTSSLPGISFTWSPSHPLIPKILLVFWISWVIYTHSCFLFVHTSLYVCLLTALPSSVLESNCSLRLQGPTTCSPSIHQSWVQSVTHLKWCSWDFPGGPVARTVCSQCRGPGFDPWLGN